MDRIKEDDLAKGMLPPVIVSTVLTDLTTERVLIPGGQHPRMKFVDDVLFAKSFSAAIVFNTTDPVISLRKGPGRLLVAVTAGGLDATTSPAERFTHTAAAAGVSEDVTIFEVEDDVVLQGDGAGGANGINLVQLYFERID